MNVLVDTNIWSLAFLRKGNIDYPEVFILKKLLVSSRDVFMTGIVLQELLQGTASVKQFRSLRQKLEDYPLLSVNSEIHSLAAGNIYEL